jgi:hypothetical protein
MCEHPDSVHQLGWIEPAYLGIQWPATQALATPYEDIDRDEFIKLMFCGAYTICGINYDQIFLGQHREGGMWAVTYYFFPDYALAVGKRYVDLSDETKRALGIPIGGDDRYGHVLRFWRIGCQHQNITTGWQAMHDRHDECPDCGFHADYDTSG